MSVQSSSKKLCHSLQQGHLCYVSGLQSVEQQWLCQQTCAEMEDRGYRGIIVKLSSLAAYPQAKPSWDRHLIQTLWHSLYPDNRVRLVQWLKTTETLSAQARLIQFTNDLFLSELCEAPMAIFLDTLDVLAAWPFAVDDIFAWMKHCFDLRDTYLSYHHLSFAVFSQAKVADSGYPSVEFDGVERSQPSRRKQRFFVESLFEESPRQWCTPQLKISPIG